MSLPRFVKIHFRYEPLEPNPLVYPLDPILHEIVLPEFEHLS